jgi:hypothetical protein
LCGDSDARASRPTVNAIAPLPVGHQGPAGKPFAHLSVTTMPPPTRARQPEAGHRKSAEFGPPPDTPAASWTRMANAMNQRLIELANELNRALQTGSGLKVQSQLQTLKQFIQNCQLTDTQLPFPVFIAIQKANDWLSRHSGLAPH